ncbi:hypothetical protein Acr_27g0002790 [Actinidia rufa]|uniref:Uncharacterized protein n=1 Tax=Actinidia rufa TaxID=165716 RepID=A0A7J0H630_9ERIC|nr:hypothetical protein Acr_27g0002790 [Actinidia rufa]
MNESDLQIWNNAAFDNGESEDTAITRSSWSPVKPVFANPSDSLDSVSSKEKSESFAQKIPRLHQDSGTRQAASRERANWELARESKNKSNSQAGSRRETLFEERERRRGRAEAEIGGEAREGSTGEVHGAETSFRNLDGERKIEESSSMSARTKVQRRGFSLGPTEIATGARRGVSLGPAEIVKSRQLIKQDIKIIPVQSIQNRRKSCFWKLQDIEEEKVTKERGKSLSISPKSRKTISKTQSLRQAVTTLGPKKAAKKEERFFSTIQPKKLFKEGEKSRSLPETDEERERCEKKRASSIGSSRGSIPEIGQNQGAQSQLKKHWEIPGHSGVSTTLLGIRDPLKRVAELIGRKSYFCDDEKVEASVCQALSFAEDVEEQ